MIHASDAFIDVQSSGVKEVYIKLEIYDSNDRFIRNIERQVTSNDLGSISVDGESPVRRNFSFSLINSDNEFDWGENELVWLDKRIKLFIGLRTSSDFIEYVPQGYFVLTGFSDSNSLDGKIAKLTGHDKAYLMTGTRGKFVNEQIIEEETDIVTAIKIIAGGVGETQFLFDDVDKEVPYELTYSSSDNRWNAIEELANLAECEIFYDVNGYLRLRKIILDLDSEPVVWTYINGARDERYYAGHIRTMDEHELANHIRVVGGSSQTETVIYDLIVDEEDDLWKDSPFSIQKIGTILYQHNNGAPDGVILTRDECKWRAKWELMKRLGYAERVNVDIAPNWLHDAGDVIYVEDKNNNVADKFIVQSFSLPIQPELVDLSTVRYRKVIENWDFI